MIRGEGNETKTNRIHACEENPWSSPFSLSLAKCAGKK